MFSHSTRRLLGGGAAAGVLVLSPLALVAPAHAAPGTCPAYAAAASSETSVSVSPNEVSPGEGFTATATVTIDGTAPATEGTVYFKYANQQSEWTSAAARRRPTSRRSAAGSR